MIEPKNIDRLFQEKFKDFEAQPPDHLWSAIENQMNKEKKRRVLPLWYKFAGMGALVVLSIGGSYLYQLTKIPTAKIPFKDIITVKNIDTNTVKNTKKPLDLNISISENNMVVHENKSNVNVPNYSPKSDLTKNGMHLKSNDSLDEKISLNSGVVYTIDENKAYEYINKNKEKEIYPFVEKEDSTYAWANNFEKFNIKTDSSEVAGQNEILKTNALEELLREKETLVTSDGNFKGEWSIHPSIAPLFFQAPNSGSPLDAQFSGNDKTFETTMSLGLAMSYAVTNKLSIRSGIHKLELGYNTHDIMIFANFNGVQQLPNITRSAQGTTMVVASKMEIMTFADQSSSGKNDGYLNHRMGYLEMPIEASYKLFDKNFDISLIGGLSTMFLTDNTITAYSDGFIGNLGSANNLNDIHFTSNVGIGVRYQFLKSFCFNFEPTFKYQFNTFNNDSGRFRPYFFGLYSGVSFKF